MQISITPFFRIDHYKQNIIDYCPDTFQSFIAFDSHILSPLLCFERKPSLLINGAHSFLTVSCWEYQLFQTDVAQAFIMLSLCSPGSAINTSKTVISSTC